MGWVGASRRRGPSESQRPGGLVWFAYRNEDLLKGGQVQLFPGNLNFAQPTEKFIFHLSLITDDRGLLQQLFCS